MHIWYGLFLYSVTLILLQYNRCNAIIDIHSVSRTKIVRCGDINLAGILSMIPPSSRVGEFCSDRRMSYTRLQLLEAITHSVDTINNDETILPNITIGYSIFDDCLKDVAALLQVTRHILPRSDNKTKSFCELHDSPALLEDTSVDSYHDVVGVVGPSTSDSAVSVSGILSAAEIPVISPSATLDDLR